MIDDAETYLFIRSLALHNTLEECEIEPRALYLYCSRTAAESERGCREDVLRCFVKEVSRINIGYGMDQVLVPEYVVQKYEAMEKTGSASGVVECQTIIARIATDRPKLCIVVVDALDGLEAPVQHDLIESLEIIRKGALRS